MDPQLKNDIEGFKADSLTIRQPVHSPHNCDVPLSTNFIIPVKMPKSSPQGSSSSPEELLQYLAAYKVIVCTECQYAIQPKAIARHLKEIHRIRSSERQTFLDYIRRYELAEHELVMKFTPGEFPVPLLPVQNGLQCQSQGCVHLCATEKRMKQHWSSVHGRHGLVSSDWRSVPIQTFFKGNLLRYFTSQAAMKGIGNPRQDIDNTTV